MKTSHLIFMATSGILLPVLTYAQTFEIPGEIDFYGKAELALTYDEREKLSRVDEGVHINSIFSRIGVKGRHPLRETVEVIYTLEIEVKGFDDGDGKQVFSARNTFMGLSSKVYGDVLFGRNDTQFKKSEGNVDQFKEREGNLKQIFAGQERLGDTVTYISPLFYDLTLGATLVLADDAVKESDGNAYSFSILYGDAKLKHQPFYLAAALSQKIIGIDAWRIVGQVDLGSVLLGGMFQASKTESIEESNGKVREDLSGEGFMLNIALPFKQNMAKLQYSYDNSKIQHLENVQMISLGLDHHFSKFTTTYLAATYLDLETQDDTAVSLGLRHFF